MKTKYERMTKEEKKKILENYKKTEKGKEMISRLFRLKITGILGICFSLGMFIYQYHDLKVLDYLSIIPLFLASILFIMMSYKLKKKVLNQFAIKNRK